MDRARSTDDPSKEQEGDSPAWSALKVEYQRGGKTWANAAACHVERAPGRQTGYKSENGRRWEIGEGLVRRCRDRDRAFSLAQRERNSSLLPVTNSGARPGKGWERSGLLYAEGTVERSPRISKFPLERKRGTPLETNSNDVGGSQGGGER